jgi:hypothetical protein
LLAALKGPGTPPTTIKKGKDVRMFRPRFGPKQQSALDWLEKYDDGKIEILRSAKLMGTLDQLKKRMDGFPNDKIIVFFQWKLYSIMLGSVLNERNIKFVDFTVS